MKKVKNSKKNIRKNSNYNGRNIYGERCIAKSVKLEKETAVDQYLSVMADLEKHHGKTIEYTIDMSCFTAEEARAFNNKMTRILELRTRMRGLPFVAEDISFSHFVA